MMPVGSVCPSTKTTISPIEGALGASSTGDAMACCVGFMVMLRFGRVGFIPGSFFTVTPGMAYLVSFEIGGATVRNEEGFDFRPERLVRNAELHSGARVPEMRPRDADSPDALRAISREVPIAAGWHRDGTPRARLRRSPRPTRPRPTRRASPRLPADCGTRAAVEPAS